MSSTYQVTQLSEASHFERCEDFNAKESEAFNVKESKDCDLLRQTKVHDPPGGKFTISLYVVLTKLFIEILFMI